VRVTWSGKHRTPLDDVGVYPRPLQDPLPIWVAVGGNPESAIRAGVVGLPMALAIIGGQPERFAPFTELHRETAETAGHGRLPLSINSHTDVADTSQRAAEEFLPSYAEMMNAIGRERRRPEGSRTQSLLGRAHGPADVVFTTTKPRSTGRSR
jgi:alkanesulfonate monooxygenase SsuD/methylene tetrahydromethanopterin reductase-like flavin-dependent oxidoreductase (luciferase family)